MFLTKDNDTMLTILQDRPDDSSWMALWSSRKEGEKRARPHVTDKEWSVWKKMRQEFLQEPPRRMREHHADFLVYEIFHRVVKLLRPICFAYARRLGYFHQFNMQVFETEWLSELSDVHFELTDLARSIRPMRQVVRRIINDSNWGERGRGGESVKTYMADVEDAIEQHLEDFIQLQEMARTLTQGHQEYREERTNVTLFTLSIVSAVFLPAQFLTGLYGMNFQDQDGRPTIPELKNEHGYALFWCLLGGCLLIVTIFLCCISKFGHSAPCSSLQSALKGPLSQCSHGACGHEHLQVDSESD